MMLQTDVKLDISLYDYNSNVDNRGTIQKFRQMKISCFNCRKISFVFRGNFNVILALSRATFSVMKTWASSQTVKENKMLRIVFSILTNVFFVAAQVDPVYS